MHRMDLSLAPILDLSDATSATSVASTSASHVQDFVQDARSIRSPVPYSASSATVVIVSDDLLEHGVSADGRSILGRDLNFFRQDDLETQIG